MAGLPDLERILPRQGTGSLKWDGAESRFGAPVLPLWVADMDFPVAPCIVDTMSTRLEHPIFGYPALDTEFCGAARRWWAGQHGWAPPPDSCVITSGVVPALFASVRAFSRTGEAVVVPTPVYPPFLDAVRRNGRALRCVPLLQDGGGRYGMDWNLLDRALSGARLLLFCSPHNPVGTVWRPDELERLAALCQKHGVQAISDEIHAGLAREPHTSLPALHPTAVLLGSAGKTFNTAGLGGGIAFCSDRTIRARFQEELLRSQNHHAPLTGMLAAISAWNDGQEWLRSIQIRLAENARTVADYLTRYLPETRYRIPGFGYLAWIDVHAYGTDARIAAALVEAGLGLSLGPDFGPGGGGHVRLNFAAPPAVLEEGLHRLRKALHACRGAAAEPPGG